MTRLSKDAKKLYKLVPAKGTIGGGALREQATLSKAKFEVALEELKSAGRIAIGVGRGGSIRRVADDARTFLAVLDPTGHHLSNAQVKDALGWSDERYWDVHARLRAEGLIEVSRGRGGRVGLAEEPTNEDEEAVVDPNPGGPRPSVPHDDAPERDWYPLLLHTLQTQWGQTYAKCVVQETAWQGRRSTGGVWSRPDLTAVTCQEHRLVPLTTFDVWTFEVKRPGDWSIVGVHEASAHGRRSTQPVLLLVSLIEELDPESDDILEVCAQEAARLGVGLVVAFPPYSLTDWDWVVEPERHEPSPTLVEEFLTQQLTPENQTTIEAWHARS